MSCPYRGLAPFDEEFAPYFYGRAEDVDRLVENVDRHPVVAVTGRSGTGKSSLLRAGLLPVLRRQGAMIAEYRTAPGISPSRSLAIALADPLGLDPAASVPRPAEFLDRLGSQPLVLIVDQFEELVATNPEYAKELFGLLVPLATARPAPPYPLRVVLTLRWESLGSLLTPDLAAVFEDGTMFLAPMSRRQLREAIVRPAEHAPGLYFEKGLVERILDDAGTEPGQLPLVESLLTELWVRRSGGCLTMRDYDALGGVNGALVDLAERAVLEFTGPGDAERLRRLLTRLAQPTDDGFVRAPVGVDQLEPELDEIAHRLADGRLIVLGSGPDGAAVVELAHQALIDHWPRLRDWLIDDREFLSWRQRLETQYEQWKAAKRDHGALLRGAALATALDWLQTRGEDVPEESRDYIGQSRRRQRREVRRWRVVTAVLAVLVLAAGTLTALAVDRGNRIRQQLNAANAESLAQQAAQHSAADPVTAAQLALAAYHSDPSSLTARTALARQHLAMRSVDAVFPALSPVAINSFGVSDDGRTAVVGAGAGVTIFTGLDGSASRPQSWEPPGFPKGGSGVISPDGHWFVGYTADNRVLVWDLSRKAGPTVVAEANGAPAPEDLDTAVCALTVAVDDLLEAGVTSVPATAVHGALHMRAAVVAGRAGRPDVGREHLAEARYAATQVSDDVYLGTDSIPRGPLRCTCLLSGDPTTTSNWPELSSISAATMIHTSRWKSPGSSHRNTHVSTPLPGGPWRNSSAAIRRRARACSPWRPGLEFASALRTGPGVQSGSRLPSRRAA